ncbi:MAG: KpsF/GutQ family sugar-phosphate isomerase [Planctomycetes bacterium]|nr:KpsF/GutQ family sugar-phosphate isomerase [Planctomycetota bacterium]
MSPTKQDLDFARSVLTEEAHAIAALQRCVDDAFARAADVIYNCRGQVVLTGIGKAGLIAKKISGTLASTGTPSIFLHPTDALHGDLGRVQDGDVVLILSHSGATQELIRLLDHLKRRPVKVITLTGEAGSPLAVDADVVISYGPVKEACQLGLAPSVSTTCMLAMGDALALTVMRMKNFTGEDFARHHPGGSLGLTFVRVERAMSFRKGGRLAVAGETSPVRKILADAEKIHRRAGALLLVDEAGRLTGILTDADLRRRLMIETDGQFMDRPAFEIMIRNPKSIHLDALASEALDVMTSYRIAELPVLDNDGRPVGLIDLKDLAGMGGSSNG